MTLFNGLFLAALTLPPIVTVLMLLFVLLVPRRRASGPASAMGAEEHRHAA